MLYFRISVEMRKVYIVPGHFPILVAVFSIQSPYISRFRSWTFYYVFPYIIAVGITERTTWQMIRSCLLALSLVLEVTCSQEIHKQRQTLTLEQIKDEIKHSKREVTVLAYLWGIIAQCFVWYPDLNFCSAKSLVVLLTPTFGN